MDVFEKLKILTDSAKYDVACTSSGVDRNNNGDGFGSSSACGICHSFSADGRCISLLKILLSNECIFDCKYCVNRKSNDVPRASFTPREVADITVNFYKRNYIEGLFLSSAVVKNPTYTTELMTNALKILRNEYHFHGYIHAKAIPGADERSLYELGLLADRMSANIELPSEESLRELCPNKTKKSVLGPMKLIKSGIIQSKNEVALYRHAPKFVPAGQSTQMIVGATGESDYHILKLSEGLYSQYALKRVFYSAYIPVVSDTKLPALDTKPPLLREHRLYQADWLLRYYGFNADELLDSEHDTFNPLLDPKCNWAINHPEIFPVDVNRAPYELLLRVPGIGVRSAKRITYARRNCKLDFVALNKIGVVLKRAKYFILCGKADMGNLKTAETPIIMSLLSDTASTMAYDAVQTSLFDNNLITREEELKCLTGQM